jgi:hypothetical protein
MAYSLKPGRPVPDDVARMVRKQARLAAAQLRGIGSPDEADEIHRARRHIKKAAAALRLLAPVVDGPVASAARRLKAASHLIAPVADARALVDCLDRLAAARGFHVDREMTLALRASLIDRSLRSDRRAELDNVVPKAMRLLEHGAAFDPAVDHQAHGFDAIAPGLETSVRRARQSMREAATRPTRAGTHRWRRRVKNLWYHVRLLDRRCGYALRHDRVRLELLDGLLGEWRNIALIEEAVLEVAALPSRTMTAHLLRELRRRKAHLRRRALVVAGRTLAGKPRDYVRRVRRLWLQQRRSRPSRSGTAQCQPA